MVHCLESKSLNDINATIELYTELQELLQNKTLGLKQISTLVLKQKSIQKPKPTQSGKKLKNDKSMVIKKSIIKSKITHGKSTPT